MDELLKSIKIKPFDHQLKAATFALSLFGVGIGGDATSPFRSHGCGLLMEM